MSLGEHFREFRRRAVIAAIAIVIGAILGWIVYDTNLTVGGYRFGTLVDFIQKPLQKVHEKHPNAGDLNYSANGVSEAFSLKLKVSIWFGFIISSPVWLWQLWGFLAPGLTKREKRIARGFLAVSVPLFLLGCWVSTFALPNAIEFLLGSTPSTAQSANLTDAQKYYTFIIKFILVFGLAFLLPVFLTGLNMLRILPGRIMVKGWRVAVMAIAVFSAIMSPSPDAWSMLALMVPMIVLYFAAILIAMFLDRRRAGREEKNRADWLDIPDDQKSAL
ncbi:twin-arginine translocase subunit TatC [Flexivirga meconopsidis]|uniref:twin-arginine translocase subunit TatC n=1 Tax=Flexivirga meconopsidis TaxID=2977121 RepID=UPI0022407BA2|nr:twin-arginine translocase subunit TatC [Flexivirga meconopsidis]